MMQAAAVAAVLTDRTLIGSALYVLAINHKHMAMYFAPAFCSYLLGKSLRAWGRFGRWQPCVEVASLGCIVVGTFLVVWAPFLASPPVALKVRCCGITKLLPVHTRMWLASDQVHCIHHPTPDQACSSTRHTALAGRREFQLHPISVTRDGQGRHVLDPHARGKPTETSALTMQALQRLVPLQRGLFEDYVANFWCVSHPLFKWKRKLSQQVLARVCVVATLAALLPACVHQVLRPSRKGFLYCLVISALSFFMFSYQVRQSSAHCVLRCSAAKVTGVWPASFHPAHVRFRFISIALLCTAHCLQCEDHARACSLRSRCCQWLRHSF
jgi:hypothetical protein